MSCNEERLAKNRQRDHIRSKRKKAEVDTMMRETKKLDLINDILRKKNVALIQELARYGVAWGEGSTPTTMSDQTVSISSTSPSRFLRNTRQKQRNRIDAGHSIYSRPFQNTVAPMTSSTSLYGGTLSSVNPSQQVLSDSPEKWQQYLRDKAAADSALTDLVYPPFMHTIHTINVSGCGIYAIFPLLSSFSNYPLRCL